MTRNDKDILWRLFRPHTLTASFVPVLIGTALGFLVKDSINMKLFAAMMIASVLIQAATNMFNEYYDFVRGLDTAESIGIAGAITRDGVSARSVLLLAVFCFVLAGLLGIYICAQTSWWLLLIGAGCMAAGYLYTGGPLPIAYTPFGELCAGLMMGSGIIMISHYIQTGMVTYQAFLISIPSLLFIGAILMSNNIRDRVGDERSGRKTLAILLGHKRAVYFMAAMFVVAYLWLIALVISNILMPWTLIALLSIPKAIQAIRGFVNKSLPAEMMPAMKYVAQTNTFYGLLLVVGLLL